MKNFKKVLLAVAIIVATLAISQGNIAKADEVKDPKLVLESYEVVSDDLTAGNQGVIRLTIKNESKDKDALNVLLSYISEDNKIYPVYGKSNQVYVGNIAAGKKVTVDVEVSVSDTLDTNTVLTTFELAGTDGTINFYNQFFVAIPVVEKLSLKVNNVSLAQNSVLGAKSLVSVGYSNDGLEDIYNAVLHIEGNIDVAQRVVGIGDIAAGENKYLDYYVIFQQSGNQQLKIYFTYEDKNGNAYSSDVTENTVKVVETTQTETDNSDDNKTTNNSSSKAWMVFLVIGVLLLVGVGVSVIVKSKR